MRIFLGVLVLVIANNANIACAAQVGDMNNDGAIGLAEAVISLRVASGLPAGLELGQYTPAYIDNRDGTLTDTATNLMWQQADDGIRRTWESAGPYCSNLTIGNHTEWRLPTKEELKGLVRCSNGTHTPLKDIGTDSPYMCGDGNVDPYSIPTIAPSFTCQSAGSYWSSSDHHWGSEWKWGVDFFNGINWAVDRSKTGFVRCVR